MKRFFQNRKNVMITICVAVLLVILLTVGLFLFSGKCYVKFESNGGGKYKTIWLEKGEKIPEESLPKPVKEGYVFCGWYVDEECNTQYIDAKIKKNTKLYASFEETQDVQINEMDDVSVGEVDKDFSLAVVSTEKLTNKNLDKYIKLTVHFGEHSDGSKIVLKVKDTGKNTYHITGNYAAPGRYSIELDLNTVHIDTDHDTMKSYALTEAARIIQFSISGKSYENIEYTQSVKKTEEEQILAFSNPALCVSKESNIKVGDVISLPYMEGTDYFKVTGEITESDARGKGLAVPNATQPLTFYQVELATLDDVFEEMSAYTYQEMDEDDYAATEEQIKAELMNAIQKSKEMDQFTEMLLAGAEYTPTYQEMSLATYGEVVEIIPTDIVTPAGVTVDVEFDAENPYYNKWMYTNREYKFAKFSIEIERSLPIRRLAGGNLEVSATVKLDFWFHAHTEGWSEKDGLNVAWDAAVVTGTHTDFTFELAVSTQNGMKQKVITEEFKAIMSAASDPSVESFLDSYNSIMSGPDSVPVELFRKTIVRPIFAIGVVEISLPVDFVIKVDFRASMSANMVVMTGEKYGIEGDTSEGVSVYTSRIPTRSKFSLQLRGKVDVRVGVEMSAVAGFIGLSRWGNIALSVQAGPYVELYGFYYLDVDYIDILNSPLPSAGGAYYTEVGAYVNINVSTTVLFSKYQADLFDMEFPVYTIGTKEVLYQFADAVGDTILMESNNYYLPDTPDLLDALLYDITEEKSDENPRERDSSAMIGDLDDRRLFKVSFDNPLFRYDQEKQIIVYQGGQKRDETIMTIHYFGARMRFRDSLAKQVKVTFWDEETLGEYDESKADSTCKVSYSVDGVVCKTAEYKYGSRLPNAVALSMNELPEELYNKGYLSVKWQCDFQFVTEDITIEGNAYIYEGKYNLHYIDENGIAQVATVKAKFGEVPDVSAYEKSNEAMTFVGWDKEFAEANLFIPRPAGFWDYYAQYDIHNSAMIHFDVGEDGVLSDLDGNTMGTNKVTGYWRQDHFGYRIQNVATRNDYNFMGWEYNEQVYKLYDEVPLEPGKAATLKAVYKQKPIKITFNDPTQLTTVYANMNEVITLPNYLVGDKAILGWRSAKDDELYTSLYFVTGEDTLTPVFEEQEKVHTVFYNLDGGVLPDGRTRVEMHILDGETGVNVGIPVLNTQDGRVFRFSHWSPSIDEPVTKDTTYKAIYSEIFTGEGIHISDGKTTEPIDNYLEGSAKVKNYSVKMVDGIPQLTIQNSGLTLLGNGYALIEIQEGVTVNMKDLTLNLTDNYPFIVKGDATIQIQGNVTIQQSDYSDAIRGESGKLTLKGIDGGKLTILADSYGIRTMGTLAIENLTLDITARVDEGVYGVALSAGFSATRLQPITIKNSSITINEGVIDTGFIATNSTIAFGSGPYTGIDGYYYDEEITDTLKEAPVVTLKNSTLDFGGDIRLGITLYHAMTETLFELGKGEDENYNIILTGYASEEAYLAALGQYTWLVEKDAKSKIK